MTEKINVKEHLEKIIQLQEMDAELYDLVSEKESFPERLKAMDDSLETKKTGMIEADEKLKSLQLAKNGKEMDVTSKEEKIKKHDGELYQIKNNKEYKALQQEIDSITADVSLLEEELLNIFDEIEKAKEAGSFEKKIFEEEKQTSDIEKKKIQEEEIKLNSRIAELKNQRSKIAEEVAPEILQKYDQMLEYRGKIAIAEVDGEICGGCHMQLRPQVINNAKLKRDFVFCENCGRIIYA